MTHSTQQADSTNQGYLSSPFTLISNAQADVVKTHLLERFIPSVTQDEAPAVFDKIFSNSDECPLNDLEVADEYQCTDQESFIEIMGDEYYRLLTMLSQCLELTEKNN